MCIAGLGLPGRGRERVIVPKPELERIMKGGQGATDVDRPASVGDVVWVRESPRSLPACRCVVVDAWADGRSVLLERVVDTFDLPPKRPSERPRLRLTRAQRTQLFNGQVPDIEGVGKPPVGEGETIRLSAKVSLRVDRITYPIRKDKKRGWKLFYEVRDTRDTVKLLRRTPPAHRAGDELDIQDSGAIAHAAEQSFYTSTPGAAVSDAGEAPDREWVDVRTRTVREFDHQRRLAKHAEKMRDKSRAKRDRKKAA